MRIGKDSLTKDLLEGKVSIVESKDEVMKNWENDDNEYIEKKKSHSAGVDKFKKQYTNAKSKEEKDSILKSWEDHDNDWIKFKDDHAKKVVAHRQNYIKASK